MNTKVARAGLAAKTTPKKRPAAGFVASFGENSIAFGMLWDRIMGAKVARSVIIKAAAKYSAGTYVVLPANDGKRSIGLLADTAGVEKGASKKSASSAAALLALGYPGIENAAFGVELPNRKIGFIGFRAGAPLIGFDRVVSGEVLSELVADFLKEFDEQSAPTVQFHGTTHIFPGRTVEKFDGEWFSAVSKKALVAARVRRAKAPTALLMGVIFAAAAAYGAFTYYEHQQASAVKQVKPVAQNPQALYVKSANEYLSAVAAGMLTAGPMTDKINRLPMFHQGWVLEKASCTPETCTLSWNNAAGGTYQSFASSALPGLPQFQTTYKEGMTGLETSFTVKNNAPKGFQMEDLPKQDQFVLFFGSQAQEMEKAGLTIRLDKGAVVAVPTAPAGTPPITESTLKEVVVEGTWKMTGDWTFYQALASLPGNMTVDLLEVGITGESMAMSVTGKYYVKK